MESKEREREREMRMKTHYKKLLSIINILPLKALFNESP